MTLRSAKALALEKGFAQRRAGLAPPDQNADDAYVASLVVVPTTGTSFSARALTAEESAAVKNGYPHQVLGRLVPAAVAAHDAQRQTAIARARATGRASAAQREAQRLADEARQFDE